MKNKRVIIPAVIFGVLFSCVAVYFFLPQAARWAVVSIVEVPACTARITDRLGIEADFPELKDYIVESLQPGMTPEDVESVLGKIGPVEVGRSFVDEEQGIHSQLLIRLCDNPLGNVVLLVYYSKDGHLLNVVDPYDN